jgi:hypothetical protein
MSTQMGNPFVIDAIMVVREQSEPAVEAHYDSDTA